jgi:peptidoglycan/xylan/chitin deacetylase (PgdA/CDA1 family)/glycosyltransferase involved in cell wall biosynthesis
MYFESLNDAKISMLKLSVVIPTFNRRDVLERTLPALLAQDLPPQDYEVIIVMDGSTDGTAQLLREWKPKCTFSVLETPNRGPSAARNVGVEAAAGELVLFLDDDLICVPELLRLHCESHADGKPSVVHGPISIAPGSVNSVVRFHLERMYGDHYRSLSPTMEVCYPADLSSSIRVLAALANSSMPRELLLACGGFDEKIRAAEDLELGLRLWKMRVPFRFTPLAIAREVYVKSTPEYLGWQERTIPAGDWRVTQKHPEYRPYSMLATFAETNTIKKWLRNFLMRAPVSPAPLLTVPLYFEESLCRFGWFRKVATRLMISAGRMMRLRSSLRVVGSWDVLRNGFDRKLTVLMYHHVGPLRPNIISSLTVSPEQFERQLRWLKKRGYVGIKPADWLGWVRKGTSLPKKPVLITFDDAYEDTANFALPLLRKYGFGGVVFVVTRRIGKTNTWDEERGAGTLKIMSAEKIRHWAQDGIEFGGHTLTHPDLTSLSHEECKKEIAVCKEDLSKLLGTEVVSFAYPFGEHDADARRIAREHYDIVFSTDEGINYLQTDLSRLRRTYIGPNHSIFEFALLVRWGDLSKINKWRAKFQVRTRLKRVFGLSRQL